MTENEIIGFKTSILGLKHQKGFTDLMGKG